MMKAFSIDGPIYKFMTAISSAFLLTLCWLVGTLIGLGTTIGVSTVACCDVGLKMVEGKEGYIVRQYIQAYKKNLRQGIPLGIIALVAFYTVYLDFEIFIKIENASIFLLMWGFLSCAIFFCCFVYAFPLCARYENTLMNTIKNSFRISIRYYGRTVLMAICIVVVILAFQWNLTTMLIGLIIGPAAIVTIICGFSMPIFRKIQKQNTEDGVETYRDEDSDQ